MKTSVKLKTNCKLFSNRKELVSNLVCYAIAIAIAYGLKSHYSTAGPSGLLWILAPTAQVVEWVTGVSFVFENGTGYICRQIGVVIAPACAGVNFLIICFITAAFAFLRRFRRSRHKLGWLAISLSFGYAFTISVNAFRIYLSVLLLDTNNTGEVAGYQTMHRIAGTLSYLSALCLFYAATDKSNKILIRCLQSIESISVDRTCYPDKRTIPNPTPFLAYLFVAIAVPLLNNDIKRLGREFPTHCATVVTICIFIFAVCWLCRYAVQIYAVRERIKNG